jgi:hypothetical protein
LFTTANGITLAIALLAVASTWGALAWRMARVEKDVEGHANRLREMTEGREKQGKRIGVVEGAIERLFERTDAPADEQRRRRRPTMPGGLPPEGDDS